MTHLKQQLKKEIDNLYLIAEQYQNKEITAESFYDSCHHLGVYPQSNQNELTLRLFTLCGVFTIEQLQFLADMAAQYSISHLHLTSGQTIHLHNVSINQARDIMLSALEFDIFSGTVDHLPLHISLSPLSGILPTESFDPTPYAYFISNYFNKINCSPKHNNYKIAFSNSIQDTAFATVSDVGFIATMQEDIPFFKLYLAGGFYNHIIPAICYPNLICPNDVLLYTLAYIDLIESQTNENRKPCAMMKDMDEQTFLAQYEASLDSIKLKQDLPKPNLPLEAPHLMPNNKLDLQELNCLFPQKQPDLFTVLIHPLNGVLEVTDFKAIIQYVKSIPNIEARLGFNSSLYFINLNLEQANFLLQYAKDIRQQTKIEQSISCTGLPMCLNGKVQSQQVLVSIMNMLKQNNVTHNYLPCICISGCENSCTRHQIGYIGLEGKKTVIDEKPCEAFDLYIGGRVGNDKTTSGINYGVILASKVPDFIYHLALLLGKAEMDFPTYFHSNPNEFDAFIKPYLFS